MSLRNQAALLFVALLLLGSSPCAHAAMQAAADAPDQGASRTATQASEPAPAASAAPNLLGMREKMSYATGVMTGRTLEKNKLSYDIDWLIRGLRDSKADQPLLMSEKEIKFVLQAMQTDIQRNLTNERMVKASISREKGILYQNDYKKQAGVKVLPGNLMYRFLTEGKGDKPGDLGTVVVRYKGMLVDGTEFESSPENKTVTVRLADVMTGWREVLAHVPAGSVVELVIPPNFAFGTRGRGSDIGPNETLIYKIELVAVVQ